MYRLTAILRSIDFILLIKSSCEDNLISSKYKLSLNLNTVQLITYSLFFSNGVKINLLQL